MEEYIRSVLHIRVESKIYEDVHELPLLLRKTYQFYELNIGEKYFLIIQPKVEIHLKILRKHYKQIVSILNKDCVLYLQNTNYYTKDVLIKEGIPFIWDQHQIYLPQILMNLDTKQDRVLKNIDKISYLTQKILLISIYENWKNMTVTQAAEVLDVTKMSITKSFDEIEVLGLPFIRKSGRNRFFSALDDKKEMWNLIKPHLRKPILKTIYLSEESDCDLLYSGYSALSQYSLVEDNKAPTYAVSKKNVKDIELHNEIKTNVEECKTKIEVLGYVIPNVKKKAIDPLSLYLLLSDDLDDPRIEMAIDNIVEESLNDERNGEV